MVGYSRHYTPWIDYCMSQRPEALKGQKELFEVKQRQKRDKRNGERRRQYAIAKQQKIDAKARIEARIKHNAHLDFFGHD